VAILGPILGPVAVCHSIKKDEPIKEMLDNVVSGLTAKVLERFYGDDESKIHAIDYLGVCLLLFLHFLVPMSYGLALRSS